jgi:hypothetical protein
MDRADASHVPFPPRGVRLVKPFAQIDDDGSVVPGLTAALIQRGIS